MLHDASTGRSCRAAMFVDYENLYSVLTSQSADDAKTGAYAAEILEEVRRYLEEGDDTPTVYGRAYGPFDVLLDTEDSGVPSHLHRLGVEPAYVPAAMQGNTSELQLTIEVTRFLTERPDVQTIVLVTGDRPFLPLVRSIREQGRRALVAAVNPPQTDRYDESELYLDARNLLSKESREELLANAPESAPAHDSGAAPTTRPYDELTLPAAQRAIAITEEHFGQYEEVYLTPLLRKLSDTLGPDHDPKALVSELEAAGAVRLEKRSGYPYDYTVLIVHDDHPDVRAVHEDASAGRTDAEDPAPADEPAPADDETAPTAVEEPEEAYEPYDHDEFAIDDVLSSDEETSSPASDEAATSSRVDGAEDDPDAAEDRD
ncbi:MAG: NYN domain-containing protein [Salinibacter sp.]